MQLNDAVQAAKAAVSFNADKPASATVLDTADVRLVVFRLAPGQAVARHTSTSTVLLTVLSGCGTVSGTEAGEPVDRVAAPGDVIAYAPGEAHGMRADTEELLLLATIAPRPGSR